MHELIWHLTLEGFVSPSLHTLLKQPAFKPGAGGVKVLFPSQPGNRQTTI